MRNRRRKDFYCSSVNSSVNETKYLVNVSNRVSKTNQNVGVSEERDDDSYLLTIYPAELTSSSLFLLVCHQSNFNFKFVIANLLIRNSDEENAKISYQTIAT